MLKVVCKFVQQLLFPQYKNTRGCDLFSKFHVLESLTKNSGFDICFMYKT